MNENRYYSDHADEFIDSTKDCDMCDLYHFFEAHLKKDAKTILDLGFGSGRDSLYFLKHYDVTSMDPTPEFCEYARRIGLPHILCIKAEEMTFDSEFDGIWACASLLHVEKENLSDVFFRLYRALRKDGVLYCSFKYGDFDGERGEDITST